jgi:hypothetical protein
MLAGSARPAPLNYFALWLQKAAKNGYITAMHPISSSALRRFAVCLLLALLVLASSPLLAQTVPQPQVSPLGDPAAYLERQFGPTFKLDATVAPMFGDLDGDGAEDVVMVATSSAPLQSQEQFGFKVADPYDAYYGTGNVRITSQFTLHFDGSSRCILIVFNWRSPSANSKRPTKFVLINTPFESTSIVHLRLKKKNLHAIEAVDRTTLHSLIFWDGKHWHWSAQGMEGDDSFRMPPPN